MGVVFQDVKLDLYTNFYLPTVDLYIRTVYFQFYDSLHGRTKRYGYIYHVYEYDETEKALDEKLLP